MPATAEYLPDALAVNEKVGWGDGLHGLKRPHHRPSRSPWSGPSWKQVSQRKRRRIGTRLAVPQDRHAMVWVGPQSTGACPGLPCTPRVAFPDPRLEDMGGLEPGRMAAVFERGIPTDPKPTDSAVLPPVFMPHPPPRVLRAHFRVAANCRSWTSRSGQVQQRSEWGTIR